MITAKELASICESQCGLQQGKLATKSRREAYITARRLFAYFCNLYGIPDREALPFVDIDRTSFCYLRKSAEDMYVYDTEFREIVLSTDERIKDEIGANKYSKKSRATLETIEEKLDMIIRHLGI